MALDFGTQRINSDRTYEVTLRDGAGATIGLTGVTLAATLRDAEGGPALATLDASVLNARGGVVQIAIDDAALSAAGLTPGRYLNGLDLTDGTGQSLDATG